MSKIPASALTFPNYTGVPVKPGSGEYQYFTLFRKIMYFSNRVLSFSSQKGFYDLLVKNKACLKTITLIESAIIKAHDSRPLNHIKLGQTKENFLIKN